MANGTSVQEDSVASNDNEESLSEENTLLGQEREESSDEQQSEDVPANDSSQESQSDNEDAVTDKRLKDTQAKVTELAEQLKAAQSKLDGLEKQREEPFDEEKFIDDFIGGEEAYERYRDDPALLAKDLAKKLLYHNANVLVERDKFWQRELDTFRQKQEAKSPEYAELEPLIKELEQEFDMTEMSVKDKVKLAKRISGGVRTKVSSKAPPPGPRPSKSGVAPKQSKAPPGYFEMLNLVGDPKPNNTLL